MSNQLPHEVVLSIQRVLELQDDASAGDSLDSLSSFDPTSTLNNLFPDETSLSRIEEVQAQLTKDAQDVQMEIRLLSDELHKNHDPNKMQLIQEMISMRPAIKDLMSQMSRIREQASESEAVVRSITKDIQLLDLAKKNLMSSMTALKRFQMLANALSQLEELVQDKKYAEISQTLAAVKELSAPFKSFLSIPSVALLWARIQTMQGEVRTKLDKDFDAFFLPDPSNPVKHSLISNACLVVDVIGEDFRAHLIDRYCAIELKEYRRIFRTSDEAGQLDNLSRRFAFFKRVLQNHDTEHSQVFPSEWKVGQFLSAKFVDITRDDLSNLLERSAQNLTVSVLLQSLQQALEFETFLSRKYSTPLVDILRLTTFGSKPVKSLASAFEPHMTVFTNAQDKALSDMLAPHRGKKSRTSLEITRSSGEESSSGPVVVLPSSTELFYFYAQILEQCSKLFNGKPLLDLSNLQKKWLKIYAEDVLLQSLKKSAVQQRRSMDTRYDANELRNACLLINTSDYCQVTASQLEERIKDKIADEYKDKISFEAEQNLFLSVIATAILNLLRELESACELAFDTMTRINWGSMSDVSGPSPYVTDLIRSIEQVVDAVNSMVEQKKYLRNFHDKAASLILTRFTNALVKSRPLRETGAEQLLLDLQEIRAALLKLPGDSTATASFNKGITKTTTRLETLLKAIIPQADPPEGFVLNYTLLIGDASFSNFQKVLDLKGTPRAEQNTLLDTFVTVTSTKPELEGTSFLSTLDMEPQTTHRLGNLSSPAGSRVHLPSMLSGASSTSSAAEGIIGALSSPPPSGPSTGSDTRNTDGAQKRDVFSDVRRLVSFGLRRDTAQS